MLQFKPERLGFRDGADHPVPVSGKSFRAHLSGALYSPRDNAVIVADLHFEKGSSFAARGQMLPPYDTRETLMRLAEVIDFYAADTVIALGDSFHDCRAIERMCEADRETLKIMQNDRNWIWVTGNHDPEIADCLGGDVVAELRVDGITLRHEPASGPQTHEIAGHLHPAARVVIHGTSIRRPCFVGNGRRLVLPAFGAYTGGLNVLDAAFEPIFKDGGLNVFVLGQEGLYPVAARLLRED